MSRVLAEMLSPEHVRAESECTSSRTSRSTKLTFKSVFTTSCSVKRRELLVAFQTNTEAACAGTFLAFVQP